ncbi:MAG: hypothetical protein ABI626_01990 [Sphingomicrobium sp.]
MKHQRLLLIATLLMAGGCSRAEQDAARDVHESPAVSPTAAPGVAWRYAYQFELPDEAIAVVQEAHAAKCEALGVARCRITGLQYSVNNDNAVLASLEVKLAPDLARQFGKDATAEVTKADGRLSHTEFSGEDTAPASTEAARMESEAARRIADIEKQLGNRVLKDGERAQLQQQLSDLRAQVAQAQSSAQATQERLASTPMAFNYYGKGGISGFAGHNPVMDAARSFVSSLVTMVTIVLQVIAVLLPWALLGWLFILLFGSRPGRAARRWLARRKDESEQS